VFVASHIFISHSSKDQKVARTICTALENRGLTCWVYSRNIQPGQNFQEQIVRAIRAAKIMVLVFTANANSSNEIKKELAIASQNNLVVIPVRIEDVIPNEAFAYEFATRQWIDLFDDWESSIARLVELIVTTSDDQSLGDQTNAGSGSTGDAVVQPAGKVIKTGPTLATRPASFVQHPGSRWAMILGAAVIVVAGIAYGVVTLRQQPVSVSATPTTSSPTQSVPPAVVAAPTSAQQLVPPAVVAAPTPAQQPITNATKTEASDPLRLNLVTDCDRLAALPGDPESPRSVTGVVIITDIVPALTACNAAMRQYPDVARFTYEAGRVAAAQKDYEQARQLFEKAITAGNTAAMTSLGGLYQNGNGVPQDYAAARSWYEKAAAAGQFYAMFLLGSMYQYGNGVPPDNAEARKWYEKAAAGGVPGGMNGLGMLYYTGSGVPKDYVEARKWFEKAAALGGPAAMTNLGNLYYDGNGVPQDYAAARAWFEKGAAAGFGAAMFDLGNSYYNGRGAPKDYDQARAWYLKAVAAGYAPASAMISKIDSIKKK
jgi:TPR repeat protein